MQIHVDDPAYKPEIFKPYRLVALFSKKLKNALSKVPIVA